MDCLTDSNLQERHSEHHPGEWFWPHANKTVEWFDWADGQPNNLQGQDCLAMTEFHNPFIPVFREDAPSSD